MAGIIYHAQCIFSSILDSFENCLHEDSILSEQSIQNALDPVLSVHR